MSDRIFTAVISSMKSPKHASSLSPTAACIEIGCCAILRMAFTRARRKAAFRPRSSSVASPAEFLQQLLLRAHQLADDFDHVYRDADGARLVRDGSDDGLPNPPRGVSGKLVATAILETSTPFIRPMLPSWMMSRNARPRFVYFLPMEMTNPRRSLRPSRSSPDGRGQHTCSTPRRP